MNEEERHSWRLLPWEEPLWKGAPVQRAQRRALWFWGPIGLWVFSLSSACFAALLHHTGVAPATTSLGLSVYIALNAGAVWLAPRFLIDPCEYLLTNRRILWRRGRMRRSMDRDAVTFLRIHWHPSISGQGHLELVRALPFGPLSRRQRLTLHNLRSPQEVAALVRGVPDASTADADSPLAAHVDASERVLWGGAPSGWMLGWQELSTAALGMIVTAVAGQYAHTVISILLDMERSGLRIGSPTWLLFVAGTALSALLILGVGISLLGYGTWRARAQGRATDYLVTDRRVLIRRGRTELSIDRTGIVDLIALPRFRGHTHVHLILDSPQGRALGMSGALAHALPPRATVPPILYDLYDVDGLRHALFDPASLPTSPPLPEAA